jgi:hypothetical protein
MAALLLVAAIGLRAEDKEPTRAEKIEADAKTMAQIYIRRFGEDYRWSYDKSRRIVFVTSVDTRTEARARRILQQHLAMHRAALFPSQFQYPVTILLPSVSDYRDFVGEVNAKASGIYVRKLRTLASISFSSVLLHELTHAVHHNDQLMAGQEHVIWVVEGLASYYQQGELRDTSFAAEIGPDLQTLQDALENRRLPALEALLKMDRKLFMAAAQRNYAHSRYVMYYLAGRGKLGDFYAAYKRTFEQDPTGGVALEEVLGEKLEHIDESWRKWLKSIEAPWQSKLVVKAHLGIRMRDVEQGVEVDALLRGSAARGAGVLKRGDVILSIGGRATQTPRELSRAVQTFKPGQTVVVELVRDGRKLNVSQILGSIRVKR